MKKTELIHKNYKINFDRFNKAFENNFQLEALLIIFAIFEQVTSNILVRLASINEYCNAFIHSNLKSKNVTLKLKIDTIRDLLKSKNIDSLIVIKTDKRIVEFLDVLNELDSYRKVRNSLVHGLMLSEMSYEEIIKINIRCKEIYKVLNKNANSIKAYISKNNIEVDMSELSKLLDHC